MKKGELFVLASFIFVVFLSVFSTAITCSSDSQTLFSLYSGKNSHVSSYNNVAYSSKACYGDFFASLGGLNTIGSGDRACNVDNSNVIFYKYSENNSHVSSAKSSSYSIPVCYGGISCHAVDTSKGASCFGGEIILASLYQTTNSHVSLGNDANYPIKICCSVTTSSDYINLDKVVSLIWADTRSGAEVSSVLNGTYVNLTVLGNFSEGEKFDYQIYLKNALLGIDLFAKDKLVSSGSHVVSSSEVLLNKSSLSWLATWAESKSADSKYYFGIITNKGDKTSADLVVSKEANKEPTKTTLLNPLEGQAYLVGEAINLSWGITEEHYPIKKIEFKAGSGANINNSGKTELSFEGPQNILLNLNLTLNYSSGGQKQVTLLTTDGLGNVYESRANILVVAEGLNSFARISSPSHASSPLVDSNGRIQFSALGSYVINKTGTSYVCALGNCPTKTSGKVSVSISNSLSSDKKLLKSSDSSFNWSGSGLGATIYGKGNEENITIFSRFQSVGESKEVTLNFSYLNSSSKVTNVYSVLYSSLLCNYESGNWVEGANVLTDSSCYNDKLNSGCCSGFNVCTQTSSNVWSCQPTSKYFCYQYESEDECDDASFAVANKTLYNSGKEYYSGKVLYQKGSCIRSVNNVECVWDEEDKSCGVEYSVNQDGNCGNPSGPGLVGTCLVSPGVTSDSCDETGFLSYSWKASWMWASGKSSVDDINNEAAKCQGGENKIACPAELQVPFFGVWGLILVVIILIAIYFLLNKNKKKEVKKDKKVKKKKTSIKVKKRK